MAIAPYICQTMLIAVIKEIRKHLKYTWGHLDDILMAHENESYLRRITAEVINKLEQAGWMLSEDYNVILLI